MLPLLTTSRLVMFPLSDRHLSRFLTVAGERAVADMIISIPHPLTEPRARAWIYRAVAESAGGQAAHYAISIRPDDALVGYIAIKSIDSEHHEGELSFLLEERYHGRGYTTEAAQAVIAFAFTDLHLNRICAYHMVRNPASGRVLAKLGFEREGCLRQRVRKGEIYEDVLLWARLRNDNA